LPQYNTGSKTENDNTGSKTENDIIIDDTRDHTEQFFIAVNDGNHKE